MHPSPLEQAFIVRVLSVPSLHVNPVRELRPLTGHYVETIKEQWGQQFPMIPIEFATLLTAIAGLCTESTGDRLPLLPIQ